LAERRLRIDEFAFVPGLATWGWDVVIDGVSHVVILHCRGPSKCFRRLLSPLKNVGLLIDLGAGPLTHHTSAKPQADPRNISERPISALERKRSSRYIPLMNITPEQIRAARALLHLGQAELAARAHVSVVTIRRLERGQDSDRVAPGTVAGVRDVLEKAGAEFIPDGVRRRPIARQDARALYEDLRAISLRSAALLQDRELLTDADLYDEDGLPA
jgi:transcriptional regulator with XRE-family HTH domain